MLDDALVELETAGCKTIARTRVATVENRHVVFLCHFVDGIEEREEVLLCVDILLTVGREQDIFALLQAESLMHIACLNLCKILVEYFCHW